MSIKLQSVSLVARHLSSHSSSSSTVRRPKTQSRNMLNASSDTKSWVMSSSSPSEPFVRLPNERILYTSPPRTSLTLSTKNSFPGAQPFNIKSDGGIVYITNQRIVYIPTSPKPELQSFSAPILNLQDTYVRTPFFGANYWTATVKPVSGGGIPSMHPFVELTMTFREGGAYDYDTIFRQIKDRLQQAYDVARESGQVSSRMGGINMANVDLEQLPAYAPADGPVDSPEAAVTQNEINPPTTDGRDSAIGSPEPEVIMTPNEPPPGYEEAQIQAVGTRFEDMEREEALNH